MDIYGFAVDMTAHQKLVLDDPRVALVDYHNSIRQPDEDEPCQLPDPELGPAGDSNV